MEIKLFNTESRKLDDFEPLEPGKVSIYHCGPTVYWTQHIGNMRAVVCSDLIRRTFQFADYDVELVRNYTDVGHLTGDNLGDADSGEDRMDKAARREQKSPEEIAEKYIQQFDSDITALNVMPPTHAPKATEHIQDMIKMTETLLDKGYAYTTELAVYFDVSRAENYTRLSGQDMDKLRQGAGHGDVSDPDKRSPLDFSLWFFKAGEHANALQTWPSPFSSPLIEDGEGFPGWHIECSAMSQAYLGDTMDIHIGGIEHIPIHHTNEIAQSEGATGEPFVHYWLHNEHLLVDGGKMSKSEGTSYVLDDIRDEGFDPLDLRYFYLQAHYRSQQNFTWEALGAARNARQRMNQYLQGKEVSSQAPHPKYLAKFKAAIGRDFNIPRALAITWDMLKDESLNEADKVSTLLLFDEVLGLNLDQRLGKISIPESVQLLAEKREGAREDGDFKRADMIREQIENAGFAIKDTEQGSKILPQQK